MSNILIEIPVELTKEIVRAPGRTGRLATTLKNRLSRQEPSKEIKDSQAVLRRFVGKFGIVGLLDSNISNKQLEARTTWVAYSMVDQEFVDKDTLLEVRAITPEETSFDAPDSARRSQVIHKLVDTLKDDYEIPVVYNTHPILPSHDPETPIRIADAWNPIAHELDGFSYQFRDNPRPLAVLAITSTSYARNIFSGEIAFESDRLASGDILTLRSVGDTPRENLLLGPQKAGVLASRELQV